MKCPVCEQPVSKPARQGGIMLKSRYVRVTVDGTILFACPGCANELERLHGRLVLHGRPRSSRSAA